VDDLKRAEQAVLHADTVNDDRGGRV
jgi:hypothetical protein